MKSAGLLLFCILGLFSFSANAVLDRLWLAQQLAKVTFEIVEGIESRDQLAEELKRILPTATGRDLTAISVRIADLNFERRRSCESLAMTHSSLAETIQPLLASSRESDRRLAERLQGFPEIYARTCPQPANQR